MNKGFAHLIPLLILAVLVGVSSVGVVGAIRSKAISTSSVLSSNTDNSGRGKVEEKKVAERGNDDENEMEDEDALEPSREIKNQEKSKPSEKSNRGGENQSKIKKDERRIDASDEVDEDEHEHEDEDDEDKEDEATKEVRPGRKIRSNFPITVNPVTNEKTVTTPSGVKTIILPEVAIQNMIKAGFPVVLPPDDEDEGTLSASPQATSSGSTGSADLIVDESSEIQLTEKDGKLVYEIPAIKAEKFVGVLGVKIKVKGIVSAENGEILKLEKSFFDSILDLLSF